ncbi:MAG: hypothetical protein RLZZ244_3090 [Verrucomicrobiota bacterium]
MTSRALSSSAALACALLLSTPQNSRADFVYRAGTGWTHEGGMFGSFGFSKPVAKTADLQLSLAEDLEKKGDLSRARSAYRYLVKTYGFSQQAATARYRLAGLLHKEGRLEDAFDSYNAYIEKHPDGNDFPAALDAMFTIAKRFMDGEKRRLLGIKMFSSNQRAEEMFDTIYKRAPFAPDACKALYYRGILMERQGKDAEAILSYQLILERFPSNPIAEEAQYQIGFVRMRSVRTGSYDKADRIRAQESFEDFLSAAPSNPKSLQARQNIQDIEKRQIHALLDVAKFYEKSGKLKAATMYYRDVLREAGDSPEAKEAQRRIDQLQRIHGAEAVRLANEPAENPDSAAAKRRMQAAINTNTRADYVGPAVAPAAKQGAVERAPTGPALRLSPADINPLPEPSLLAPDAILNPSAAPKRSPAATEKK